MGLDRDLKLMPGGKDDFELQLNQEIDNRLNHMMASVYTQVESETLDDGEVCVIWVESSPEPVFFDDGEQEEFYVRSGSSADPRTIQEAQEYIAQHFG